MSRSRWTPVTLVAVMLLVSGCSLLPTSGGVHRDLTGTSVTTETAQFAPPAPLKGDSPTEVAKGFMLAMTAVPLSMTVARSFIAGYAQAGWEPGRSTLIYQSSALDVVPDGIRVQLGDAQRLDARGGWLGPVGPGRGRLDLHMVRDHGEWRIANPPDAIVVPQWYIDARFRAVNVYFFDQSDRVLVPDRVYLPRREQLASRLVRALLAGPGSDVADVTRTAFPANTSLDIGVPVTSQGEAQVPLSGDLRSLPPAQLNRVVAQLAWTLRQVEGVTRVQITVGDTPITLPDGRRDFSVQEGDAFSPTVNGASDRLFGVDAGRVVGVRRGAKSDVSGPFGHTGYSLREIGVALDEKRIAEVAGDGGTVYAWNDGGPVRQVLAGSDALRPSYDMYGGLWLVDNAPGGARIYLRSGGSLSEVNVPGVSGHTVNAFAVSRDATRLVAAVQETTGDRLVSSLLLRTAAGDLIRPTISRPIGAVPYDLGRIVDLTWRSPNDLAVLSTSQGTSLVTVLPVDGSPGDATVVQPDPWPGRATAVVGSPDSSLPLFLVVGGGQLERLDAEGHWKSSGIALRAPTYAG